MQGLGKTIQVCAFTRALFESKQAKRVLILGPTSVLSHWETQMKKWNPKVRIAVYESGGGVTQRRSFEKVLQSGGVCISTYGLIKSRLKEFQQIGKGGSHGGILL